MPTKNHHVLASILVLFCLVFSMVQPASARGQQATFEQTGITVDPAVLNENEAIIENFTTSQLGESTVSGVVTDGGVEELGSHGFPLYASIHVTADGFDQTIYTDPFTGRYEIELVDSITYTFVVNAVPAGYNTLTESVTPSGSAYTHDIHLMVDGAACAAPGYQPDYDIFYNFESSGEGFTPGGTTSFAWGKFTSGPGQGHSGAKGIATNPAGDYNANEDGWMTSPIIDLTSFGTNAPVIQWNDWKNFLGGDSARLDVSKDGGVNWLPVWGPVGNVSDTAYQRQTVALDPTFNVANFQFRFYFKSDGQDQYAGWYVDDIGIYSVSLPEPTAVFANNFDTDNGGFVSGGTNSSWAWGSPSIYFEPGGAHSDPNVWATNLTGQYNHKEESYIISPVIDLSSYTGLTPTISFWQWSDVESGTDRGVVEVTKDGGAHWINMSGSIYDVSPWLLKSIQLDAAYAVSDFQFRFHFSSDSSGKYAGWYIDDVAVTVAEPFEIPTSPCIAVPGGVVAGYVFDNITDEVLVGSVVNSPTVETTTFELEGDSDNAGLYWVFQPAANNPEEMDFTAAYARYANDIATVTVVADAVTRHDFFLNAGRLRFNPTALEHTMTMGDSQETETLKIINSGLIDATYELAEKEKGFAPTPLSIPAFTGALPEDSRPVSMARAPETAATPVPSAYGLFNGLLAGKAAFAVDIDGDNLVSIPDSAAPGTWTVVGSVAGSDYYSGDFTGGDFSKLYVINDKDNNLYALDINTAASTLVGKTTPPVSGQKFSGLTGTPAAELYGLTTDCSSSNLVMVDVANGATTDLGPLPGVNCGIDLAYNTADNMIYIVDIVTDNLFKVDPETMTITQVGSLGANANHAQGMDYEETTGILYWAANTSSNYVSSSELRVIDMTTGASTLVGAFPGGANVDSFAFATGDVSDVPWLSIAPASGSIAASGSTDIAVTFDPSSLMQPGNYMAELKVKQHDTPYSYANIPIILHLQAPANFGSLNGTVNGMEACDVNPAPLKNVTVNIYDQENTRVGSTSTLANGSYNWALVAGTYDVEIVAPAGYVDQRVENVVLAEGATISTNINLRLKAPCISVTPESLEEWLLPEASKTVQLSIENSGAAAGNFAIDDAVEMVLDDGSRDTQIGIGGSKQFIFLNRFTPPADAYPFELTQIQVFFDSEGSVVVGDNLKLVVYENTSGNADPAVGSDFLAAFPVTVQSIGAWNNYTLPTPITLEELGDVLIGVVALETPGSDYRPAALDTTATRQRSWIGWWTTTAAPETPTLPPDEEWTLIDDEGYPGNWMIRGMGTTAAGDIFWLSEAPLTGTVPADGSLSVDVTFDAASLTMGDYKARLRFTGMSTGSVYVPVTMKVITCTYLPVLMR